MPSKARRTSRATLAATAMACTGLLAACSGSTQPAGGTQSASGSASAGGNKTVAFSPLALKIPAMQGLSEGIKAYATSKGYQVLVQDPNLDAQKQVTQLQDVIESGRVGGAWAIAVQPSSLSALVAKAQQKKVPLILNGTPADYGLSGLTAGLSFDTIDYAAQGKAKGEALAACINAKLGGTATVFHMVSTAGTAGKEAVEKAELEALAAGAPKAKVVATLITTDRAKAQVDVGSALQGHPDANTVLATNDEAALGALGAFAAAGKQLPCVAEAGGNDEVLADVKSGKIYASVALQFQADMAQSFDTLVAMMADPTKIGVQLTVPQKVLQAGS